MKKKDQPVLGVIGGVGPYAGLELVKKIFDNTKAHKDQDHLNVLTVSCPSLVPDRTDYILGHSKINPAEGLFACAKMLYGGGSRFVSIACNTAHSKIIMDLFTKLCSDEIPELRIVNMIQSTLDYVQGTKYRTIGLLATKGTHLSGVYGEYFNKENGYMLLEPEKKGIEKVHDAIFHPVYGIKAKCNPVSQRASDILSAETWRLFERGAQAVVMGCTEIPMALMGRHFEEPLLDPALITARAMISMIAPEKLKSMI